MLLFHVGGFLILYVLMRLQGVLPFNPADQSAVPADLAFNTAVSFITNTNWQNYGGESTLSYLVQMLGLTHQNFLVGGHRHRAGCRAHPRLCARVHADHRQFLGRCDPLHALRPAADLRRLRSLPRLAGHAADAWCRTSTRRRWRAPSRRSRSGPWPRRSPSRCSAPTAAASSTPMPPIPSRTRRRCRTSCR